MRRGLRRVEDLMPGSRVQMCIAEGVNGTMRSVWRIARFNGAHRKYGMHCERNDGVSHSKTAHSGMQYDQRSVNEIRRRPATERQQINVSVGVGLDWSLDQSHSTDH